jgi:penicillin amidase
VIIFRLFRWLLIGIVALVLLIALFAGGMYFYMRGSVPETTATYNLPGLSAEVKIYRDGNGIPYIYAASTNDAYFGLGFVHAQDRLFQMDFQRRVGQGRLAEIVGGSAAPIDRIMRVLGLYRLAERSIAHMSPESRRAVEAYTRGVNAWLKHRRELLPPEFFLLWYEPEPWTLPDTLVWGRLMALQLSVNWRAELLRMQLRKLIGDAKMRALFPAYPDDAPTTIPKEALRRLPLGRLWAALPHHLIDNGASNEWVISGDRSASGKPILANDPHLGMNVPTLWYLAHISAPGLTVSGVTVPGVPYHIIAHNDRIAWGVTTSYIDTDDLFIERVNASDPTRYDTPDGPRAFIRREETIKVRFSKPQKVMVRQTRHGPVLDSILFGGAKGASPLGSRYVLTLKAPWLREDDTTADAFYLLNRARNWQEFRAALRRWQAPLQNVVYADVAGNIGYQVPGRVPIRKKGTGWLPSPGWTDDHAWTGFIPFDKLPSSYNPADGFFVNANSRIVGKDYPYFLSHGWGDHFRAQRIVDLIEITGKHTPDSFAKMQGDHLSLPARTLAPLIVRAPARHKAARRAKAMLRGWDFRMARGKPEPLILMAWARAFGKILITSGLPKGQKEPQGMPRSLGLSVIVHLMKTNSPLCNIAATPAKESCRDIAGRALDQALTTLVNQYGDDMAAWRWCRAHQAHMSHRTFTFFPILRDMFDLKIAADGGQQTINKAQASMSGNSGNFDARSGPGVRAIFTFDDLRKSRFMIATGQSGNPYSPWYGSLLAKWAGVKYLRFRANRKSLETRNSGVLTLRPAKAAK